MIGFGYNVMDDVNEIILVYLFELLLFVISDYVFFLKWIEHIRPPSILLEFHKAHQHISQFL